MGGDTFVDWRTKGKCANLIAEQYDKLFFPTTGRSINKAKSFCSACPVIAQCLQAALDNNVEGIWAGTSEAERKRIKDFRRGLRQPITKQLVRRGRVVRRKNFVFS